MSGHKDDWWCGDDTEDTSLRAWIRHDPCMVGLKRKCWDPISTAVTLVLVVFAYSSLHSFTGHALYQGGMRSAGDSWKLLPIINIVWTEKDCPKGHEPLKAIDSLHREIKTPQPSTAQQGYLCIQRGGLPSDIPGELPRPREHCLAKEGLRPCSKGKFPYCGKLGVECPLVDVSDFAQVGPSLNHQNDASRIANMRFHCNTSIPSAYLPWTGCRPINDMVISTTHPCFKYSTNGWGARSWKAREQGRAAVGPTSKKCVRRDSRYRLMQVSNQVLLLVPSSSDMRWRGVRAFACIVL